MNVPDDLRAQMAPMPDGFTVPVLEDEKRSLWRGKVTVSSGTQVERLQLEIGWSKTGDRDHTHLAAAVWEAQEVARLGRADLLSIYRTDRHKGRPRPKAPPLQVDDAT